MKKVKKSEKKCKKNYKNEKKCHFVMKTALKQVFDRDFSYLIGISVPEIRVKMGKL